MAPRYRVTLTKEEREDLNECLIPLPYQKLNNTYSMF
jgi:hypothetical protein